MPMPPEISYISCNLLSPASELYTANYPILLSGLSTAANYLYPAAV